MAKNIDSQEAIRACTGCGICEAVCPSGAIRIKENENGFYRPEVDESKCTDCSLCIRTCYKFDGDFAPLEFEDRESYSAVNKNEEELRTASSGGVSTELMKECLHRGYYVAGVVYDAEKERAVTKIARTEEELAGFKGSKYFQSYTVDAFKEILDDRTEQKYAIFGTPCQIYAFHKAAALRKKLDKYLFVDIFCHGCPGLTLWDCYLDYVKEKHGMSKIDRIDFRSKTHGWHEYCMDFYGSEKKVSSSKYDDPFYELFFGMDAMNEACYDCICRSTVAMTDIRIGDFWGKRHNTDLKGVSAVVISTERGKELWESVADKFEVRGANFTEIVAAQSYKTVHRVNEKRRESTLGMLKRKEKITAIVKKRRKMLSFKTNLKRSLKSMLKHLPSSLYVRIKTVLG